MLSLVFRSSSIFNLVEPLKELYRCILGYPGEYFVGMVTRQPTMSSERTISKGIVSPVRVNRQYRSVSSEPFVVASEDNLADS